VDFRRTSVFEVLVDVTSMEPDVTASGLLLELPEFLLADE